MYVYGVVRAEAGPTVSSKGIDDQPVDVVASSRLAAVVSAAPPDDVRASRRNLMAHTRVLQEVVADRCVLPMRFGVVMPGEEAVKRELLEEHEERLLAQLDAFDELVELDLKVLCPEDVLLRTAVEERPEIRRRRELIEGRALEATYYERIALGEMVAAAVEAKREELTRTVLDGVGSLAMDVQVGQPLHEQMVANVALLVERARVSDADTAVERLEKELGPHCRVRYVGPLPPYSFTALDSEAQTWA